MEPATAKAKLAAAVVGAVLAVGGYRGAVVAGAAAAEPGKSAPPATAAAASGPASPGAPATILNGASPLRSYLVFRTPVFITSGGEVRTATDPGAGKGGGPANKGPFPAFQSPLPPADWTSPEFDDSAWAGSGGHVEVSSGWGGWEILHKATANSVICARWKFLADDPAGAQDLRLSLAYVGGAVAYVNGQEVARGHMPAGEVKPETLAEKYPDDLYVVGTKFLQTRHWSVPFDKNQEALFGRRYRSLADKVVPGRLLRKGTNVLAVEIHRAPVNEAAIHAERQMEGGMSTRPGLYSYAALAGISLTGTGAGIAPNLGRPRGIQVWNVQPFETVTWGSYGHPGDALPVAISAARNSVFSGRLVVSSDQLIRGLKVKAGELKLPEGGGTLPASAVRVRWAEPAAPDKCWLPAQRFDRLTDLGAEGIPAVAVSGGGSAVVPLWLTVRVPKDARAGRYEGTVTVEAEGLKATTVPLVVTVSNWTMPEPRDFRLNNFGYHSGDALALYYKVPMWSDRHFELMGKSLALMAEVNSRQAIVNLAINFYASSPTPSNAESMVRWVKQPDGSYKYDFTIFDKYLDTVAKAAGKPALVRLGCWNEVGVKNGKLASGPPNVPEQCGDWGFPVSVLDPATGKVTSTMQPVPGTEESYKFWKPVLDEVRKRIEARGWWDVTAMGHNSYSFPMNASVVSMYRRIWPDGAWSYTAHNGTLGMSFKAGEPGVAMPVRHADALWTINAPRHRGCREMLGPRPNFWCFTWRSAMRDWSEVGLFRHVPEDEIMRAMDGVSDFGVDLFPLKGDGGRYYCIGNGRGTGGPGCSTQALLAPGPDGPVATERFEMLREGLELAEAVVFLERTLQQKKIGGDLEQRVNRCLDERSEAFLREWGAGRMDRDRKLLALAGEVAGAMGQ